MTGKPTYYQKLRTIRMPVIEARLRLLWQLELKFERTANERIRELHNQGIKINGDMFHINQINDRELQKLMRGYLKYHHMYESMKINEASLHHEVYKFTGEHYSELSVAEIEENHLAKLRAKRQSA